MSHCTGCKHIQSPKENTRKCEVTEKSIYRMEECPLEPLRKKWTQEEADRLPLLLGSGTHIRNIALIMGRSYEEVMNMVNKVEKKTCDNCGRIRYCRDKYQDGCELKYWQDTLLTEIRTTGMGVN